MAICLKADCDALAKQPPDPLQIRELQLGQNSTAFRTLNEEWITRLFVLESKDIEMLDDPEGSVLRKGGHIFLASQDGKDIGCVALIPIGGGVFELSKMAVAPFARGKGIGRKLVSHVIEQARRMDARSLFLGSSSKLPDAVHLYEAAGFKHLPADRKAPIDYARADIFMELVF